MESEEVYSNLPNIEYLYKKDISKFPILNDEKQRQLVREYRKGYKEVADCYRIKTRLDIAISLIDKVRKIGDLNLSEKELSKEEFSSIRSAVRRNISTRNLISTDVREKYKKFAYQLQLPNKFLSSKKLVNLVNGTKSYEDYEKNRITLEDFDELLEKAKENKAKRDNMVVSNLRLVFSVAKEFVSRTTIPFIDLVQSGNEGLMVSTRKFDPDQGVKFASYAHIWIKQHIRRSIHNESKTIRTPIYIIEETSKLKKALDYFEKEGLEPNLEELSKTTKIRKDKIQFLLSSIHNYIPFEDYIEVGVYDNDLYNKLEKNYNELVKEKDKPKVLEIMDKTLNEKEKKVIRMRYGIGEKQDYTLEETGKEFGFSKERARQIEEASIRKLKRRFEREKPSLEYTASLNHNQKL